jgi:hypothetical protein
MGIRESLWPLLDNEVTNLDGNVLIRTEFRESNELAASLSSFVDPVDGPLDRFLKVEPSWFGIDGGGLVLLQNWCHFVMEDAVCTRQGK